MATNTQIRQMTTAQPFRPFTVKLVGGKVFAIRHPENIAIGPNGRDMAILDDEGTHLVAALLVELIEPVPSEEHRQGNGE
jgi:hypothetical protein